jgi:hypothetical protein
MSDFIFPTNVAWNISRSSMNWVRYDKKIYFLNIKHPLFLSDFNETLIL